MPQVERYRLADRRGRHLRWATRVRFEDGCVVNFTETVPKGMALSQAKELRSKGTCSR